ncbi:MAG: hypothetical protein FWE82_10185, partial [Defluviitaleaceae bacterium]|nr:hypothetical protein [Defluviitaleaceae bacterium]
MIKRFISVLLFCTIITQTILINPISTSASITSDSGYAGGSGTAADPYQIATAAQLQKVGENLNSHYLQVADIDLAGVHFTPLGTRGRPFAGIYDGGGYSISNLYLPNDSELFQGLFSYIRGRDRNGHEAGVRNLTLLNSTVLGYEVAGSIAGAAENAFIENCAVSGNVYVYMWCAGGILGLGENVRLIGLMFKGNVTAPNNVGGIAGEVKGRTAVITDCGIIDSNITGVDFAPGTKVGEFYSEAADGDHVGGIAAQSGADSLELIRCYVERSVITGGKNVSGLFGSIYAVKYINISECFVSADIFASSHITTFTTIVNFSKPPHAGAIKDCYGMGSLNTGENFWGTFIHEADYELVENCYVSAEYPSHQKEYQGAFVIHYGEHYSPGKIINCYFDASKTSLEDDAAKGLDADQMRSAGSFEGFDFGEKWAISPNINEGMPYLKNNPPDKKFPDGKESEPDFTMPPYLPYPGTRSSFFIELPQRTGVLTVPVSGLTEPMADVMVYCNFEEVGKIKANHVGRWAMTFRLPGKHTYETFLIYAVVNSNGIESYSYSENLIYDKGFPTVSQFSMFVAGPETKTLVSRYDDTSLTKQFYTYTPGYDQFTLGIKFMENSEPVEDVFIETIDRQGNISSFPAAYDVKQGGWIASAFYDSSTLPINHGYTYKPKHRPVISRELYERDKKIEKDFLAELQINTVLKQWVLEAYEGTGIEVDIHEKGYTMSYNGTEMIKLTSRGIAKSEMVNVLGTFGSTNTSSSFQLYNDDYRDSGYSSIYDTDRRAMYVKYTGNSTFY